MPFHFCADELILIFSMLPFIGAFFRKLHVWWHIKFNHRCHHKTECQQNHLSHPTLTPSELAAFAKKSAHDPFSDLDSSAPLSKTNITPTQDGKASSNEEV